MLASGSGWCQTKDVVVWPFSTVVFCGSCVPTPAFVQPRSTAAPEPGVAGSGAPALSTSSSFSVQVTVTGSGLPLRW